MNFDIIALVIFCQQTYIASSQRINKSFSIPIRPTFELILNKLNITTDRRELISSKYRLNPIDELSYFIDDDTKRILQQNVELLQGLGTHYVTAWVGTPIPQRVTLIVDTGSKYTAFPCDECHECGEEYHTDSYYHMNQSMTFQSLVCKNDDKCYFHQSYGEGSSWKAYRAIDEFYISDYNNTIESNKDYSLKFDFGCIIKQNGLFIKQLADGIMGLQHDDTMSFLYQYFDQFEIKRGFGLCLSWGGIGHYAGVMTLGDVDTGLHNGGTMVYAKDIDDGDKYAVHIRKVYLRKGGGTSAKYYNTSSYVTIPIDERKVNSGSGAIVDSGTTDTYLNKYIDEPFRMAWKDLYGKEFTNDCFSIENENELGALPTIVLQLLSSSSQNITNKNVVGSILDPDNPNDILIAISPYKYLQYNKRDDTYCIKIYFTKHKGSVLGANTMNGYDVYFDIENHRIGFCESSCDYKPIQVIGPIIDDGFDQNDQLSQQGTDTNLNINHSHYIYANNTTLISSSFTATATTSTMLQNNTIIISVISIACFIIFSLMLYIHSKIKEQTSKSASNKGGKYAPLPTTNRIDINDDFNFSNISIDDDDETDLIHVELATF